jgi:hypothetical protein
MGVLNGSVSGVPLPFQSFFGFYAVFGSDRIGSGIEFNVTR